MIITENTNFEFDKNFELDKNETLEIKKRFIIFHAGAKLEYLKRFVV